MADVLIWPALVLLGIAVGSYGTLVGAGGGFILGPILLILYPELGPEVVTAISLGVVTANGISGTVAYRRQGRIDYLAGAIFAATALPGAVIGASLTEHVPRDVFQTAFGVLLGLLAVFLTLPKPGRIITTPPPSRYLQRLLTDSHDQSYRYAFDPVLSLFIGFGVGVVSAMFGVGGGVILVPAMVMVLRFPAYVAIATSTFVLMFSAGAGAFVHALSGDYAGVEPQEISLAVGVVVGAQVGAFISMKLAQRQELVVRLLSAALFLAGLRLISGILL